MIEQEFLLVEFTCRDSALKRWTDVSNSGRSPSDPVRPPLYAKLEGVHIKVSCAWTDGCWSGTYTGGLSVRSAFLPHKDTARAAER
jgi:hypothetical protein